MPRTKIRSKRSRSEDGVLVDELHRHTFLDYEQVTYSVADGDPDDPATTLEFWISIFKRGEAPADIGKAINNAWGGFEGLNGAITNETLEVKQECDYEAERFRQQTEHLMSAPEEDGYYARTQNAEKLAYQAFQDAIERVSADESDEEAWDVIDSWRKRQLRRDEGGRQ
jgi:hypothetical protein